MEHDERTVWCGNLSERVTEDILYELFLQAGPLDNVSIPKEKGGRQKSFGFVTFKHAVSVPYSMALFSGISLYGRTLRLEPRCPLEENKYMDKLMEYEGQRHQNNRMQDHRSRHHESRRHNSRSDSERTSFHSMNLPPPNMPVMYPVPQTQVPLQNFAGPLPSWHNTHQNQWQR